MSFRPSLIALAQRGSSKAWLRRQSTDPFIKQRAEDGFNSRSAYKLLEISERNGRFLEREKVRLVIDLGAAPGGWSQIAASARRTNESSGPVSKLDGERGMFGLKKETVPQEEELEEQKKEKVVWKKGKGKGRGKGPPKDDDYNPLNIDDLLARDESESQNRDGPLVVAVDLLPIQPIPGVHSLVADFLRPQTEGMIYDILERNGFARYKADVILSDIAPNMTGVPTHDNEACLEVCRAVWQFAGKYLASHLHDPTGRGGVLLLKYFTHPSIEEFRRQHLDPNFRRVACIKPTSSRSDSREAYYLCQGFRGSKAV